MSVDTPHTKFLHLFAVVRCEFPVNSEYPANSVSVVKVFSSQEAADQEASRPNHVNENKSCRYDIYVTRFIA